MKRPPHHAVTVPMRDGIRLHADIYTPPDKAGPLPAILLLTPYRGVNSGHDAGVFFSKNDYVFARVSCRGFGMSEGAPELFARDGRDGFDAVEWLAGQPWCNGQVAMWGGSYCGFTQWVTAAELPPHLSAIAPVSSAGILYDFPMVNNIFMCHAASYCGFMDHGASEHDLLGGQPWRDVYFKRFIEHLPFASLDSIAGQPSDQFQMIIRYSIVEEYWTSVLPSEADYRRIDIPILSITGHYDGDQRGAMMFYRDHHRYGTEHALSQHYLVFGPWNHSGSCASPKQYLSGLDFGEISVIDTLDLHLQWYDWALKGKQKPGFLKQRVVYLVEDTNCWKSADALDAIDTSSAKLYLTLHHGKSSLPSPGILSFEIPSTTETAEFTYDPLDTSPAEFERTTETVYHSDASHIERFLVDQDSVLKETLKDNGLVYESEPLENDIEMTGYPRFVVWISMDVPDTDFQVCIYELASDGRCIILTDDMMRARFRNSLTTESLVPYREINRYEFNQFQMFSRRIRKGHRLRLLFRCVNSIYWQKNYNSGGVVAQETAQDARTAHVTVHQDPDHVSFLEIPVTQ